MGGYLPGSVSGHQRTRCIRGSRSLVPQGESSPLPRKTHRKPAEPAPALLPSLTGWALAAATIACSALLWGTAQSAEANHRLATDSENVVLDNITHFFVLHRRSIRGV